jgi:hypothetical protein
MAKTFFEKLSKKSIHRCCTDYYWSGSGTELADQRRSGKMSSTHNMLPNA